MDMQDKTEAMLLLAISMASGSPSAAIEWQEREGQRTKASTSHLPKVNEYRAQYEALGFEFGDDVDELWVDATLPPGWSKRPADHAMYTDLVDADGNKRGSYFYKAAFYDRKAEMWPPERRYRVEMDIGEIEAARAQGRNVEAACVLDGKGGKLFVSTASAGPDGDRSEWSPGDWENYDQVRLKVRGECADWLAERFPDHMNPMAYWDEE